MASLERWKLCCCLSFVVFGAIYAAEFAIKKEQTRNGSSLPSVRLSCALLDKVELATFTKQVTETCRQNGSAVQLLDLFCKTLENVTNDLCALENNSDNAEIDVGFFKNITQPDEQVCSGIDNLKSDRLIPLIDTAKYALSLLRNEPVNRRTATCDHLCNGTTHILCSFMLQGLRILSQSHLSTFFATNAGNPTATSKNVTANVTGSQLSNQTPSAAIDTAVVASAHSSKTNNTVTDLAKPSLPSDLKTHSGPITSGLSSTTAGSTKSSPISAVAASKSTNETVVSGSTKTSTTGTAAVSRDGSTSDQISDSVSTSVVASSKPKNSSSSSTTTRPFPAAGPVAVDVNEDDDGDKESEIDAPVLQISPGMSLDVDGDSEDKNPLPDEGDDYDDPVPPGKEVASTGNDNSNLPSNTVPKKHGTFSIAYPDGSGSGFLPVFFMFVILSISLYFVYHYRNKIMGLLLEGRSERRRRPNTSQYRRLSNKLEDVLPIDAESGTPKRVTNVIY